MDNVKCKYREFKKWGPSEYPVINSVCTNPELVKGTALGFIEIRSPLVCYDCELRDY